MKNSPVIILGAGITGLSTAWYLEKKGFTDIQIIDASDRAGGKVETLYEDGFMIENGPDSFVVTKPFALDLIKELGLEDELIAPKTNRFFILKNGKLVSSPKGLNMMVPTDLFPFLESRFFSWPAKHRILQESIIHPNDMEGDESFADFIIRRFGEEMLDLYAGPLFTGIYATPAEELSLNATFPMLKKMEQEYGSISRAMKKQHQRSPNSSRSTFLGLKRGMQSLTDAIVGKLHHSTIHFNTKVLELVSEKGQYHVKSENGQQFTASNLVVTLPANIAKSLISHLSPEASRILSGFTSSSSRIVTLAYQKEHISDPLLATGFVSAMYEETAVSSSTWPDSKWEGRAKEGYATLRCFMGKGEKFLSYTNDELIHAAHEEMSRLLGISSAPEYYWVNRLDNALPQYKVGHLDQVDALKQAVSSLPGLCVAGAYIHGVGLPDCIKQGKDAADSVALSENQYI